jgi:DNA ligase (NAD+)
VVFTGSLEKMTRDEAKTGEGSAQDLRLGVERPTCGGGPGRRLKLKAATELGVAVLTEDEWFELIGER